MTVEWAAKRIVYFPVPKIACTTLKCVFYTLNFERDFSSATGLSYDQIHVAYAGTPEFRLNRLELYSAWRRLVVIRDPVLRFLSAFSHRVIDLGELAAAYVGGDASQLGVPVNPTIHEFIHFYDVYRAISISVRHHFAPQTSFLGPDLEAYTDIFSFEKIGQLHRMLEQEYGSEIQFSKTQTSTSSVTLRDLSIREVDWIRSRYAGDYALLREYYNFNDPIKSKRKELYQGKTDTRDATLDEIIPRVNLKITSPTKHSDDFLIYAECSSGDVRIVCDDTLTIITSENCRVLIGLERIGLEFLSLGESYNVELEGSSNAPVRGTICVRYDYSDQQQIYLGTTRFVIGPADTCENVLLDTDLLSHHCSLCREKLKLILMFEAESGISLRLRRVRFGLALLSWEDHSVI